MSKQHFDFFGLPPELRMVVYEYYCAANTTTDYGLLFEDSPPNALVKTSKNVYQEGICIYKAAQQSHAHDQDQLFTAITSALHTYIDVPIVLPVVGGGYIPIVMRMPKHPTALAAAQGLFEHGDVSCPYDHSQPLWRGSCGCDFPRALDTACSTCVHFLRVALYLTAFPRRVFYLLENDGSGELNAHGRQVAQYIEAHAIEPRAEFTCVRAYAVDFLRLELDKQEFIELRCNVRFDAVREFYRNHEQWSAAFEEGRIHSIEMELMWPKLKAFEDFERQYAEGELEWRDMYERRAEITREKWEQEGSRVHELVPRVGSFWTEKYMNAFRDLT